ncbi:hypothetical protein EMIT0P228_100210 [Pseudomonas brassicacearum]
MMDKMDKFVGCGPIAASAGSCAFEDSVSLFSVELTVRA